MSQSIKEFAIKTWVKTPIGVILGIGAIGIISLAIIWDSSNEDERLLVEPNGAIRDRCNSRETKISARLSDYLACVRISSKAKELHFWQDQLKVARRERVFAENMGKYLEYWRSGIRYSREASKLKTLAYNSLEDGFQRETELLYKIYSRTQKDRLSKLKDLVPRSPTWNQINSELEGELKLIKKMHDDSEAKIVERFQYAQGLIHRLKETEALIEEKIKMWPGG